MAGSCLQGNTGKCRSDVIRCFMLISECEIGKIIETKHWKILDYNQCESLKEFSGAR